MNRSPNYKSLSDSDEQQEQEEDEFFHHPLAHTDPLLPSPDQNPNSDDINNTDLETETDTEPKTETEADTEAEYLKITVSNPQKEVESSSSITGGKNTHVTYLISTETNLSDYCGHRFSVRRRFKDVVTLSDRLAELYRGFIIPPRPDKSVVESQVMYKQEFVELRRNAIEKYLLRLGRHVVIRKSDELRVFLTVNGKLPLLGSESVTARMIDGASRLSRQLVGSGGGSVGFRLPQDVVEKSRWDFFRIFKESSDWGGTGSSLYEQDSEFLKSKERLLNLEKQLTDASKQAELFVKTQQDMSETMGAFGLAFIKLTKFENQQAVHDTQRKRAADMKNLATAAIKASRYYRELSSQTVKHLDTLHDHMGLIPGVHTAFSERSSALLTVQSLTSELDSLYLRAEKLEKASSTTFSNDRPKTLKLGEVREAIRVTEDAKSCATNEYARIKENNRTEIERLDRERKGDFISMLKGFVLNQVDQRVHLKQKNAFSLIIILTYNL
uniref:sorting nexin 2B-like isoform X2 n=1 Tax=Erigeron canadensis TaxID=72917 RepID=UPI001CB98E1B|nr:sorting nexin 2B-like isoform X2 [Erigeron canadensis]